MPKSVRAEGRQVTPLSEKSLKVTDRRMFTPDGQLREEYRDLEEKSAQGSSSSSADVVDAAPASGSEFTSPPPAASPPAAGPQGPSREPEPLPETHAPADDPPADTPGFLDLVGLLAEPATLYLREAHTSDPQGALQSLELARLHIDLLDVLRTKTAGNLSASEKGMLEDVIFQLRSGYVGLRG